MSIKVSAGEFRGRVLRLSESSEPVEDGENADWDTGGTGGGAAAGFWEPVTSHPSTATGELLVADIPAGSPLIFADLLQNDDGTDMLYADVGGGDLVWDGTDLVMHFVEA